MTGSYTEKTTKKAGKNSSVIKVDTYNAVGRKNVFGYDDFSNLLFEGAGLAQDALTAATYDHQISHLTFAGGDVTVTLQDSYNGVAMLTGKIDGKEFTESAVVWYESINETKALLVVHSFNLGTTISYVVTVVQDYSGSRVDEVSAPDFPAG